MTLLEAPNTQLSAACSRHYHWLGLVRPRTPQSTCEIPRMEKWTLASVSRKRIKRPTTTYQIVNRFFHKS